MTTTETAGTVTAERSYEAAAARYNAINATYKALSDEAHALLAAIGDEYDQAETLLQSRETAPGIARQITAEPVTDAELNLMARERLTRMFPWAAATILSILDSKGM